MDCNIFLYLHIPIIANLFAAAKHHLRNKNSMVNVISNGRYFIYIYIYALFYYLTM